MKTILAVLVSASVFVSFAATRFDVMRTADAELNAKQYPQAEKTLVGYINANLRQGISGLVLVEFFDKLSRAYRAEGKYGYLEKLQLQTIDMWRGARATDRIMVARSMSDLAHTYAADGKLTDAETSWQGALEILDGQKRAPPTVIANYLRNLAHVRSRLGKYDQAEADYKRALQLVGDEYPWLKKSIADDYAKSQERAKNGEGSTKTEIDNNHTVIAPKIISRRAPAYTDVARLSYVQGTVVLELVVGENGKPIEVVVLEPLGSGLDDNAVKAVLSWRFEPGTIDGKPAAVLATAEVNFYIP